MAMRESCCHGGPFPDSWAPVEASPSGERLGLVTRGDVCFAVLSGAAFLKRGPLLAMTGASALERHLQRSQ